MSNNLELKSFCYISKSDILKKIYTKANNAEY